VTTFITSERAPKLGSADEARRVQRQLVYRHLAYCNALRLSLRKQESWDELAPFLSPSELREVEGYVNKPTRLTFLQAKQLDSILEPKVAQSVLLTRLDTTMSRLLDIQGGCERIKNTALDVEQLGSSLRNPFENLDNDTPMTALRRTIEIDLRQQLGETNLPPPIEPVDGVLM